jgi:hypothetical protein
MYKKSWQTNEEAPEWMRPNKPAMVCFPESEKMMMIMFKKIILYKVT